jgi:hypothetical protein
MRSGLLQGRQVRVQTPVRVRLLQGEELHSLLPQWQLRGGKEM